MWVWILGHEASGAHGIFTMPTLRIIGKGFSVIAFRLMFNLEKSVGAEFAGVVTKWN